MIASTEHPITVRRRSDFAGIGVSERRLRALMKAESVHRVVAGCYVLASEWSRLNPMQRHLVKVLEVADRSRAPQVFMGAAAAAIWSIDRIAAWPDRVEVRIPRASGGRTSGAVRRRALGFEGVDVVEWRGHLVTTPAQTAMDVASDSSFRHGVIAVDQALWARRQGGALTTASELWSVFGQQARRGVARAAEIIRFATPLADSVRESEARVLINLLGFPDPVLQKPFRLPGGEEVRADFYFEDFDHVGEFDGTGKYFDPDLLQGRTPEQALLAEKDRADALRRIVKRVSRWRTPAHRQPADLYDILTADGLPSRRPRPRQDMRW